MIYLLSAELGLPEVPGESMGEGRFEDGRGSTGGF